MLISPIHVAKIVAHKHALIFAGGVATVVVGKKIIESDIVKNAATDAVAGVMSIKENAEATLDEIKADAESQISNEERVEIKVK